MSHCSSLKRLSVLCGVYARIPEHTAQNQIALDDNNNNITCLPSIICVVQRFVAMNLDGY